MDNVEFVQLLGSMPPGRTRARYDRLRQHQQPMVRFKQSFRMHGVLQGAAALGGSGRVLPGTQSRVEMGLCEDP